MVVMSMSMIVMSMAGGRYKNHFRKPFLFESKLISWTLQWESNLNFVFSKINLFNFLLLHFRLFTKYFSNRNLRKIWFKYECCSLYAFARSVVNPVKHLMNVLKSCSSLVDVYSGASLTRIGKVNSNALQNIEKH